MRSVWIDTDMGFDDAVAIAMVAASPDVNIAGLSLVAGNMPIERVVRNARNVAAFFGWTMPIYIGQPRPLVGDLVTASHVLGETGMPSVGRFFPESDGELAGEPATAAMTKYLEGGGSDILALGPLTNIASLLIGRPDLGDRISRLVWMGGSAGRGNHTAAAEFNTYVDPEAVQVVLNRGVRIFMVGLDVCLTVTVSTADAERLRVGESERGMVLGDLMEGYARIVHSDGSASHPIYDAVAAAAYLDAQAVEFRSARMDVELAGRLTRGMTVVEWRVPRKGAANAEVAVRADSERIRSRLLPALEDAVSGQPRV